MSFLFAWRVHCCFDGTCPSHVVVWFISCTPSRYYLEWGNEIYYSRNKQYDCRYVNCWHTLTASSLTYGSSFTLWTAQLVAGWLAHLASSRRSHLWRCVFEVSSSIFCEQKLATTEQAEWRMNRRNLPCTLPRWRCSKPIAAGNKLELGQELI